MDVGGEFYDQSSYKNGIYLSVRNFKGHILRQHTLYGLCSSCVNFFHYFVTAWAKEPTITVVDTLSHSIDNVSFPAITICPRSFNSDRWGATIKTLDYMKRRCPSKG